MTVYILIHRVERIGREFDLYSGIFSTRELAQARIDYINNLFPDKTRQILIREEKVREDGGYYWD